MPTIACGSTASDFTVNRQSTYDVSYGTTKLLILDLTLPQPPAGETYQLQSIKIHNQGTADHTIISKLIIWEDGSSVGWDGDERSAAQVIAVPFFDTEISAALSGGFQEYSKNDSWQRLFVTLDINTTATAKKTTKPQLLVGSCIFFTPTANGPTDTPVAGFERSIVYGASIPTVPVAPLAKTPEALSTSTIRWHFLDLSNNEFGFKILDAELNEVARNETSNLSYIDETGLEPNTKYSGRRVVAFNDRGENLGMNTAIFSAVRALALPEVEEPAEEEIPEDGIGAGGQEEEEEATTTEWLKAKIQELQLKLIELLNQLVEVLQQQLASIKTAVVQFFGAFFEK